MGAWNVTPNLLICAALCNVSLIVCMYAVKVLSLLSINVLAAQTMVI